VRTHPATLRSAFAALVLVLAARPALAATQQVDAAMRVSLTLVAACPVAADTGAQPLVFEVTCADAAAPRVQVGATGVADALAHAEPVAQATPAADGMRVVSIVY
jgi:hypothetical protein